MQAASDIALAIIVVILGILVMSLLTKNNESLKLQESKYALDKAYLDNTIAIYLKQPVKIDESEMTLSDLMVIAHTNKGDYLEALKIKTEEFFNSKEFGLVRIKLGDTTIIDKNFKKRDSYSWSPSYYSDNSYGKPISTTEVVLPGLDEPIKLTISTT